MRINSEPGSKEVGVGQMEGWWDEKGEVDERIQGEGQVNRRSKVVFMDKEANAKSRYTVWKADGLR